jgi:hypothetical protein
MQFPERHLPYIPRYRKEVQFAKGIATAQRTGLYGLEAVWGGIALGTAGVVLELNSHLQPEALIALTVGVLAEVAAVGLLATTFFLHLRTSLQAVEMQRTFPQNPLPAIFLQAEFVRWIKRVDLLLITTVTIAATLATLGFGTGITVPSGIGLGFLGWTVTKVWGYRANKSVLREVRRQKEVADLQPGTPYTPKLR